MKEVERLPLRDFTRYCMSIAQVPSSYLAGLTIEEQILWLCSFLTNEVIPTVNNNGEAVEELQNLYTQLKDYVDNYFDNLDIQEEVNTKLEDMAESGELAELIAQYLQAQAIIGFNNNSDLADATNLGNGSFAKTYGKITYSDGKGALYKIRTRLNSDVPDGDTLIALTNTDNLVAEIIPYSRNYDLDTKIDENVQDLQDQIDNIKVQGIVTPLWDPIYIDGVNGDDDNDGTSEATAFKTLDPVIKMVEKGKLKLDLYFAGNQTYDMSKFQGLNGMSIHFVTFGDSGNVVLDYGVPSEGVGNYDCHFNYGGNENRQIVVTGCSYIYWDGGSVAGKYTTFDTLFTLWGAGADMKEGNIYKGIKLRNSSFNSLNETTFGSIDMETSSLYCYKPHFITTSDYNKGEYSKIFFRLVNSQITIVGTCNINTDNNSYEKMLEVTGTTINMGSQLSEAGSDPTAFITASTITLSQVMINQTRWNALKSRAGSISVTGSMLMDNNSYVTA